MKDKEGNIESCQCDTGLSIKNGLCAKEGNWIRTWLDIDYEWNNGYETILYISETGIKPNEIEVYINSLNFLWDKFWTKTI